MEATKFSTLNLSIVQLRYELTNDMNIAKYRNKITEENTRNHCIAEVSQIKKEGIAAEQKKISLHFLTVSDDFIAF